MRTYSAAYHSSFCLCLPKTLDGQKVWQFIVTGLQQFRQRRIDFCEEILLEKRILKDVRSIKGSEDYNHNNIRSSSLFQTAIDAVTDRLKFKVKKGEPKSNNSRTMGGNAFYSNAEAYAFEILQQKLIKEAQRSAQQTVMELSAFKSLFNQGQFIYCIPFGGAGLLNHTMPISFNPPLPALCPPDPAFSPPDAHYHPLISSPPSPPPPPPPPPPPASSPQNTPSCPQNVPPPTLASQIVAKHQSTIHVNVKNAQPKTPSIKPGSDECNLGKDGIDVTIDLKEYLPADITLNVEEKAVEIKACHVDAQGSKTFARKYDLPACIILDSVKCILSHDGYLMFWAAWLKME